MSASQSSAVSPKSNGLTDVLSWVGVSGVLWLIAGVVAQFLPLLNVPGYEFSLLVGALCVVLGIPRLLYRRMLRAAEGQSPAHLRAQLWRATGDLGAWVGISTLISLLNTLRVTSCDTALGLGYIAVFGLLNLPLVIATVLVVEELASSGWRYALAASVVVGTAAYSLVWVATQPSIVVYNPYFGYIAASLYDQSLVPLSQHLVFRGLCLTASGAAVGLIYWTRFRSRAALRTFVALVIVLATAWLFRAELGIERSREWIAEELGGVVDTEHFEIHFSASSVDDAQLAELAADHEAAYAQIAQFFAIAPGERYTTFIYPDAETRGSYMGGRRTMIAKIWLGETHLTWSGPGDETLVHELAHLMLGDAGSGPLQLSSRSGVFPLMGLVEGAATAAAWGGEELTYHGWSAAIMDLGLVEDPAALLAARGFWSRNSSLVYTLWGSFVRWLVETRGADDFVDAYARGDFEGVYGTPLRALLDDWRHFLTTIPLSEVERSEAELRFDRPSIFEERCARTLATLMDEGWQAVQERDRRRAVSCFEALLGTEVANPQRRFQVARGFEYLGDDDRASELYADLESHAGSGEALRQRARLALADMAWRAGERHEALSWLRAMEGGPESASLRRHRLVRARLIAERHERPQSERIARRYLAESWRWSTGLLVADLAAVAVLEDSAAAAYLAGLRMSTSSSSLEASVLLERALQSLSDEELRANARLALVRHAVLTESEDGCTLAAELAADARAHSALEARAAYWQGRCSQSRALP